MASSVSEASPESPRFRAARAVWPEGLEREMNRFVGFRSVVAPPAGVPVTLLVAASSAYRVFVDGRFAGHGPARAAHGHFRVDEWDLTSRLRPSPALIAVEAVGYNVNSYYLLDQPAFLQAEVVAGEAVLAATGSNGFEAVLPDDHLQRVERYSAARTFSEVFRLRPGCHEWRTRLDARPPAVTCATFPGGVLLPRRVPYPDFRLLGPVRHTAGGRFRWGPMPDEPYRDWTLTEVGPELKGYVEAELEAAPSLELQTIYPDTSSVLDLPVVEGEQITLGPREWRLLDFGVNSCGFVRFRVACAEPSRLWVTFDEILTDGDVDARRLRCVNVVACEVEAGTFEVETFEPYTLRYLKLLALEGTVEVSGLAVREVASPSAEAARFTSSDERLNRIFEAGRHTFRPNAVDLFTDCPSRERAGWPCDSFFTARAAFALTGSMAVEQAFLENYLLAEDAPALPAGMLPMNYPADHPNGLFIPNWPLWLVLQLEEHLARSGDRALVDAFAPKVRALFAYFRPFENEGGLLEGLKGWVFVEWSHANDLVQDVNYPTNMLYAAALAAAGRLYGAPGWLAKAEAIRERVRDEAFDGEFFVDHAVRLDGRLGPAPERTEVCQYYAFFFGVATPESHSALWACLRDDVGPGRSGRRADLHPASMLNGYYLRLELLSRYGCAAQALRETTTYFLPMAERTGTLWEHDAPSASCNHGFASHVAYALYRDALGVCCVDVPARRVHVRFVRNGLDACSGSFPVGEHMLRLAWRSDGDDLHYRLDLPHGFVAEVENATGGTLLKE